MTETYTKEELEEAVRSAVSQMGDNGSFNAGVETGSEHVYYELTGEWPTKDYIPADTDRDDPRPTTPDSPLDPNDTNI